MPTELLEKVAEVEEPVKEVATIQSSALSASETRAKSAVSRGTIWRKIFEDHEEFLGWTPD